MSTYPLLPELASWLAEHPANHSLSPDSEKDCVTLAATWRWSFASLLREFNRAGSSGKTYPVSYPRKREKTLAPSSGRWLNAGMACPGECWTLKTSESHSAAAECSLSDILETGDLPSQCYLTKEACK